MGKFGRLKDWVAVSVVLASFFLPAAVAHAQSSDTGALNLTTSPLPVVMTGKPGQSLSSELRVKNSGTKAETLKVGLMKFTAYGDEGKPQLKDRAPGDDYFDWVTFSENVFTVQPNEWKSITMTVNLPKTAAFDYYYAATFSRANTSVPTTDRQAKVQGGTAILAIVEAEVPGAIRKAEITSFTTSHKIYEFLPVTFNVKIKNTGNVHLAPIGTIYIQRGNKQIDTIDVNVAAGNVLPNSSRIFTATWDDGYPVYKLKENNGEVVLKNGQQVQTLRWDNARLGKLRWGRYTAHLTMVYDDGHRDVPMDATVSFWVIPWRVIGIALIPIVAFIFLSYRYIKLKKRLKALQKDQQKSAKAGAK